MDTVADHPVLTAGRCAELQLLSAGVPARLAGGLLRPRHLGRGDAVVAVCEGKGIAGIYGALDGFRVVRILGY